MPTITNISEVKGKPDRRRIFLDGRFAFACHVNVVARFRLRDGLEISVEQVRDIQMGQIKQECMDRGLALLSQRQHSRAELSGKLRRKQFSQVVIDSVLDDLTRMSYLDDARYARVKATSAAENKHHGRRRAFVELIRSGVRGDIAQRALDDVFSQTDSLAIARSLAEKHLPRLRKLDAITARRRLAGLLGRRGFEADHIRALTRELLGSMDSSEELEEA